MDFPRPQFSPSNLIGDLKDRFSGNRNQNTYDDYYDDEYYEGYPEVDDYDVYTYDEDEQRSGGSFGRTTYVRTDGYAARSPRLVSAEDVRATTSAYGVEPSYSRSSDYSQSSQQASSPAAQRIAAMGQSARESLSNLSPFSRKQEQVNYSAPIETDYDEFQDEIENMATPASSLNDFTSAFQKNSSSVGSASVSTNRGTSASQGIFDTQLEPNRKSAGLESLFSPSERDSSATGSITSNSSYSSASAGKTESLYSSDYTNPVYGSGRELYVVRPTDFGEAEQIAFNVRQNNIVVLDLKTTNADLTKRILDFSFGVVAALEGHIECPEAKVFVLTLNSSLTLEERHRLRRQGVM